jgi:hypothetical protein
LQVILSSFFCEIKLELLEEFDDTIVAEELDEELLSSQSFDFTKLFVGRFAFESFAEATALSNNSLGIYETTGKSLSIL